MINVTLLFLCMPMYIMYVNVYTLIVYKNVDELIDVSNCSCDNKSLKDKTILF